jgi:hypothetical protein
MQHRIHLSKALLIAVKNGKIKSLQNKKMATIRRIWTATEHSEVKYKNNYVRINMQSRNYNEEIREFIY